MSDQPTAVTDSIPHESSPTFPMPGRPAPGFNPAKLIQDSDAEFQAWKRAFLADDQQRRAAKQAAENPPPSEPEAPPPPRNRWVDDVPVTPTKHIKFDFNVYLDAVDRGVDLNAVFDHQVVLGLPAELADLARRGAKRREYMADNEQAIREFEVSTGRKPMPGEVALIPTYDSVPGEIEDLRHLATAPSSEIVKDPRFSEWVGRWGSLASQHLDRINAQKSAEQTMRAAEDSAELLAKLDDGRLPTAREIDDVLSRSLPHDLINTAREQLFAAYPGIEARITARDAFARMMNIDQQGQAAQAARLKAAKEAVKGRKTSTK